jgi:hypothetical protein
MWCGVSYWSPRQHRGGQDQNRQNCCPSTHHVDTFHTEPDPPPDLTEPWPNGAARRRPRHQPQVNIGLLSHRQAGPGITSVTTSPPTAVNEMSWFH